MAAYSPGRRRLAMLLAISLLAIVPATTPMTASASCNPGRGDDGQHHWAGSSTPFGESGIGGVTASIYDYDPYLYSGDTTAWTMLNYNQTYWAQVGWEKWTFFIFTYYETFTQWTHDGTYTTNTFFGSNPGDTHTYMTTYLNTPGNFDFWVDGSRVDSETATFTPNAGQVNGEVTTGASQMPGGYNAHEPFRNMQGWLGTPGTNNGSWYSFFGAPFNGGVVVDNGTSSEQVGNASQLSATAEDIWDLACAS